MRWNWVDWSTVVFVLFGLGTRTFQYLRNLTVWYDESVLLANVLGKSYRELVGPLDHAVAAPPIFVWWLRGMLELFGNHQLVFRFVPFLCGCLTLLLTVPLARRVLPPVAALVCIALVAVSNNHIWLTVTIKPYAGDTLVTTALLYFLVATEQWPLSRRLFVLALAAPILLSLSYPAAFVLGGILLALHPRFRALSWKEITAWILAFGTTTGTFALLYFGPIKDQRVQGLVTEWDYHFPRFDEPLTVPWWFVEHTSTVFQYCYLPSGFGLFALVPFGIVAAWKSGKQRLLIALVVPFLLCYFAAALKAWPYGFSRLMLFIAPCAVLLGGLGLPTILNWLYRIRWFVNVPILLIAIAAAPTIHHLVEPWEHPDSSATARFIHDHRKPGEFIASDEQGYQYFFLGELKSLEDANDLPAGSRLWVAMDYYTPEGRREYVKAKLARGNFTLTEETTFFEASAFLFEKR